MSRRPEPSELEVARQVRDIERWVPHRGSTAPNASSLASCSPERPARSASAARFLARTRPASPARSIVSGDRFGGDAWDGATF